MGDRFLWEDTRVGNEALKDKFLRLYQICSCKMFLQDLSPAEHFL